MFDVKNKLPQPPLYRPEFEHDNCGIGACVDKNRKGTFWVRSFATCKTNIHLMTGSVKTFFLLSCQIISLFLLSSPIV